MAIILRTLDRLAIFSFSSGAHRLHHQLFGLVDKYQASDKPISQLHITGHSLGSALSELFTLDMAQCRPEIVALNINYACPRVGEKGFVNFYEGQKLQQDPATQTLRVQNSYDVVPCAPPGVAGLPLDNQHLPHRVSQGGFPRKTGLRRQPFGSQLPGSIEMRRCQQRRYLHAQEDQGQDSRLCDQSGEGRR
jgi:hypothetical protein